MAETVRSYIVTSTAGEFVAGMLHGGAGTSVALTDAQARYELLLGSIVLDGTPIQIDAPAGPISANDRLDLTRGSKAWDASVGELLTFLLGRILPEVTETLGDVEGRILGNAAAADNTLGKLASRIATLAMAVEQGLDTKASRQSPEFTGEPIAPTAAAGTSSQQLATTAFVTLGLAALGLGSASRADTGSAAGNVPVLDSGGKLLASLLPALAITDTFEVASEAAMLALAAERGDVAVRSDLNRCFILKAEPASTLANWIELKTPTDAVLSVAGLTGAISASALRSALALAIADVSGLQAALDGKQGGDATLTALAGVVTTANKLIYATGSDVFATADLTSFARSLLDDSDAAAARVTLGLGSASRADTGSAAGNVPVLDSGGKLLASLLPALAITDTFEVASQAAMLALTAERGDVAVRSDLNRCFILKAEPASTLANWIELKTPTDAVLSVAGLTGAITASALRSALALAIADVSGLQAALDGKQDAAAGSVNADGTYAIQRFPSGLIEVKGSSIIALDGQGKGTINVGVTAVNGVWSAVVGNGDQAFNPNPAQGGYGTATNFSVYVPNSANSSYRFNWTAFARWK